MSSQKKAQASIEYLILIGVILILIVPMFLFFTDQSGNSVKQSQAEDLVLSLAKAADEVYSLSVGSLKHVWVNVPGSVQSTSVNGNEIVVVLGGNEIVAITDAPITGQIPTEKGTYKIKVELLDSGIVLIGDGNDTTPPTVTWKYPTEETCNTITLRINTDKASVCKFDDDDVSYENMSYTMLGNALGHSYGLGTMEEGSHTHYVRCSDAQGNQMTSSEDITYNINYTACGEGYLVETTNPTVSLVSPSNGDSVNITNPPLTYIVSDSSIIVTCELYLNGALTNTAITPTREVEQNFTESLSFGDYTWSVQCTDAYGNVGSSNTWNFSVVGEGDTTAPIVGLVSPINGSIRNFNLIKFFYTANDAESDISSCTLGVEGTLDVGGGISQSITDSSVIENSSESITISLEKGNYTWSMSCKDTSAYLNEGFSETWELRVNSTSEAAFITSCPGQCGFDGYANGVCRQEPSKCRQNNEEHSPDGDEFCTGGAQSDTCCCVP